MNDADYSKEAPAKVEKKPTSVIKGTAKVKKKSEIHKFADIFLAEDVNAVKDFLVRDVLIPGAKKLVYDIFVDGLGMLLNGTTARKNSNTSVPYVSYGKSYDRRDERPSDRYRDRRDNERRDYYNFNDVVFETRGDAERVLMLMRDSLQRYDFVSIFDLYDFSNLPTMPSDNNYGWISLRNVEVRRVHDGYKLTLPRALPRD